ncbi:uncharacterized protein CMU_007910 [Cryptosporidium muris RN66]|uniref:Uncharacterized protein n=1 Tax=Cryptosporidium muris (strain RN66) TaxID=441375 RepID=B6ADK9_CRYMR|nr:uncharacterized protein CMU_007910 [Cryptosporidium muris RN66]EEA06300.1 hypothetical protein, conserved [Cryptosporidium muris RN66]|eukprot:XP_002140649.1 hypothetical protein [Cryptosporidium muris RN66]
MKDIQLIQKEFWEAYESDKVKLTYFLENRQTRNTRDENTTLNNLFYNIISNGLKGINTSIEELNNKPEFSEDYNGAYISDVLRVCRFCLEYLIWYVEDNQTQESTISYSEKWSDIYLLLGNLSRVLLLQGDFWECFNTLEKLAKYNRNKEAGIDEISLRIKWLLLYLKQWTRSEYIDNYLQLPDYCINSRVCTISYIEEQFRKRYILGKLNNYLSFQVSNCNKISFDIQYNVLLNYLYDSAAEILNNNILLLKDFEWQEKSEYINSYNKIQTICTIRRLEEKEQVRRIIYRYSDSDDTLFLNRRYKINIDIAELHKKLNLSLCKKCSTLRRILKNICEIFNGLQTVDRNSHECSEYISVGSLLCDGTSISNDGIWDNRILEHTYSNIKEQDRRRTRSSSGVNATHFKQKDEVNESYSELSSDNLTTLVPIFANKQYRQWLYFIPYYCNYFLSQIAGIPGPNVANSNYQSLETFDKLIMLNYSNFLDIPASGLSKLTTISEKVIDYANKYGIDLSVADYSKNQDNYLDISYSSELDLINIILKSNLDEINLVYLFNNYIQPSIMEKFLYILNVYPVTKSNITNIKHEISEVAYLLIEYTNIYNYLLKSIEEELEFLHKLDDHSQKFTGLNDGSAYYYTNGGLTLNFNHYIKESLREKNKSEPRLIISLNDLWVKYPEITNLLLSKSTIGFDYISVIYGICESSLMLMQISKIFNLNIKDDNNFSANTANIFSQQFWKLEFENIAGHLMMITQLTNTSSLKAKVLWLLSLYYLFESEIVNVSFKKTFSISVNIPTIQELTQKQENFLCAALHISRIVHNLIIKNELMENEEVIYNRLGCKKYVNAFSINNSNIIIGVIERELSFRRPSSNLFASPTSYLCSILHILNETDLITLYDCSTTSKTLSSFDRINRLLTKFNSYLQEEEMCNIQGEELVIAFEILIKLTNKCIYDHIIDKENFNGVIPAVFIDFLWEILLLFETLKDRAFSNDISNYKTIYNGIKSLKDILHYLIITVVTGLHRLFMHLIQTYKGMVNLLKVMMQIVIHLVDIYQEVTSYSLQPRCIMYFIRYLFYLDFSINFEQLNEQNGSLKLSTPNLESSNSNKTDQIVRKDENEDPISINSSVDKKLTALSSTYNLILDFIILYGIIYRFSPCIPTWISEMKSCKEFFYANINSGDIPSELFKDSLYLNNWSNFYDECSEYIDKYTRFSFTHWPLHDVVIDPEIETEYLEVLGLLLQCIYGIPVCPLPCKPFNKIIIRNYNNLFKNHYRGINNMENDVILNSELAIRLPCPILLLSCNVFSSLLSCTSLTDKQYSYARRSFYDSIIGAIQSLVFPKENIKRSDKEVIMDLKSMNDNIPLILRHLSLPFIYPSYMELLHYYFELYSTRKYETENSHKYALSISNLKRLLDTYICDPFDTSYISEYLDEGNTSEVYYKADFKKKDILEFTPISILQWDYLEKKVDLIPIKHFSYSSKVFFAKKFDELFAYSEDNSQELFKSSLSEVVNSVLSRVEKCVYIPFKSIASSFESAIPLIYSNRDSTLWYPGRFGITSHTVNSGSSLPSNKEVVLEALDNLKLVSYSLSVRPDIKIGNLTSASNSIKIILCELDDINASYSLHLALGFCYDGQYSYYYPNSFERLFIQATSLLNMELEWWNLQTKFSKLNPTNKSSEFICNFGNKVKYFHFDIDSKVVENYDFCSKRKSKENPEFTMEQNNLDHYLSITDNIYSISFDLICMNMIKLKALYPTLCLRIHLIRCLIRRRYSSLNTKLTWYSHSPSIIPMNDTTCFDKLETFIYHVLWKVMEMHKHFILIYLPNISRVSNWFDYNNGVSPKIQNCFWFIPYIHAKLKWKLLKLSIIRYITNNQRQSDLQQFFKVLIDGFRSLYVYITEALLITFFQLSGDPNAGEFSKKLLENCIYCSHFEISKAVNDMYEKYRSKLLERVLSNLNSQNSSSCTPQVHNFLRIFYLLQSVQHFVYLTRKCSIFENECFLIHLEQLSDFYSILKNEISLKDAKKDIFSDFSNALCDDISDITPALPSHKRAKPTPSTSSLSHIGYSYHSLLHFIISGYSSEDCHSYFQKVFMHGRRILNIWKIDNAKLCLDHYTGLYYRRNRKYLSSKFKYLTIPVILSEISVGNLINNIREYKSIRYNSEYFLLNTNTSQNYSFVALHKLLNPEVLDIFLYEVNNRNLYQVTSNNMSLLSNEYNKDQHFLQQVVYTHLENINSSLDILCDLIIHEVKLIKQLEVSGTYEYSFSKTDYLQNFISNIRKENEHNLSNLILNKSIYMSQWSDNTEIGQLNLSCRLVCIYFDTITKMCQALIDLNLDLDGRTILKIYGIMEVFYKNKVGDIENNITNTNLSLENSSYFVTSSSVNSLSNSMTRILEKLCGNIVSLIIPSCINSTLQKYQKLLENCFYEMFCRSFVGNRTSTNPNKDVIGHDIISIIYTLREYLGITNAKKNTKRQRQTQAKEYTTNSVGEDIMKTQKISENIVYSPVSLFNDEEIIYSKKGCVIR